MTKNNMAASSLRDNIEIQAHADPVDAASEIENMERLMRLDETRRAANREIRPPEPGETERLCAGVEEPDDCGELIEPERLAQGRIRCLHCQTVAERRRGLYRPTSY